VEKTPSPQLNGRGYCEHCKFCGTKMQPGNKTIAFVCRYNPPHTVAQLVPVPGGAQWQVACIWPEVTREDYCGKFEPQIN
jgi:hypothetical protein